MRQCESQHTQAPGSLAGRALAHCGEVARPRLSAAVSPAGGIAWDIEGCIELMAACNRSIKTLLTCILLLMTPLSPASSRSTRRLGRWEDRLPATLCLLGRPLHMVHTSYSSHHSFLPAPLQSNTFHPLKSGV